MLKEFEIIQKLGEGAYSCVYKVKRESDGQIYALKKVNLSSLSDAEKQNALNEVRIIASVRHPCIVNFKECFIQEDQDCLCIIMEYADNGDLLQKINDHIKKGIYFKESYIWNILIQVLVGLKALHDMNVFHRDLKSANVFLNKDGTCKLGDFNVSKISKKGLLYTQTGTPYYASPEVWRDMPYDKKADLWSLGCVVYEMCTLKPPFRAEDMPSLFKKVIKGHYQRIPTFYTSDLAQVIRSLLQVSPQMRPDTGKLLKCEFVIRHINENHLLEPDESEKQILLSTIRLPKNLKKLKREIELPRQNYNPLRVRRVERYFTLAEGDVNKSTSEMNSGRLHTENLHARNSTSFVEQTSVNSQQQAHVPNTHNSSHQTQANTNQRPLLDVSSTVLPAAETNSSHVAAILEDSSKSEMANLPLKSNRKTHLEDALVPSRNRSHQRNSSIAENRLIDLLKAQDQISVRQKKKKRTIKHNSELPPLEKDRSTPTIHTANHQSSQVVISAGKLFNRDKSQESVRLTQGVSHAAYDNNETEGNDEVLNIQGDILNLASHNNSIILAQIQRTEEGYQHNQSYQQPYQLLQAGAANTKQAQVHSNRGLLHRKHNSQVGPYAQRPMIDLSARDQSIRKKKTPSPSPHLTNAKRSQLSNNNNGSVLGLLDNENELDLIVQKGPSYQERHAKGQQYYIARPLRSKASVHVGVVQPMGNVLGVKKYRDHSDLSLRNMPDSDEKILVYEKNINRSSLSKSHNNNSILPKIESNAVAVSNNNALMAGGGQGNKSPKLVERYPPSYSAKRANYEYIEYLSHNGLPAVIPQQLSQHQSKDVQIHDRSRSKENINTDLKARHILLVNPPIHIEDEGGKKRFQQQPIAANYGLK